VPSRAGGRPKRRNARSRAAVDVPVLNRLDVPQAADGMARRLLDSGRRNFVEHGYQHASVSDIAEEAGASVGLLYYHFSNKEGLYRAIWADYQQRQWRQAHQAVDLVRSAGIDDGRVLFLAGTRAYMAHCWENRDIVDLVQNHEAPPRFVAEARALVHEWLQMNARLLKLPDDRSTEVLVEMASMAIAGAVRVIAACPTREEADEVVDVAMRIFTHMISYGGDGEQAVADQRGLIQLDENDVERLVPSE
jgi:AcrR family transcriptional regulator